MYMTGEWTSELPDRTNNCSRLWRLDPIVTRDTYDTCKKFHMARVSCFSANKGGTTGFPSFSKDEGALFVWEKPAVQHNNSSKFSKSVIPNSQ
ncbi:hypothetical protein FFL34_10485 [Lentibacillus cibarius]|uniref:Uncharacterized protein n=1 Tax=Lentibacillus cibarius TaxID=2583219 RepID=A0A5S3QL50_9BACI|nr:hypothetical protein FFL34_10485 [Lentibacillus cibarius]